MGKNKELTIQQQLQSLNQSAKHIKDLQELFSLVEDHQLGKMCFSTSLGQEDQVLTDFIFKNNLPIDVFTLDTGRLFQESYDVLSSTQKNIKKPFRPFFQMIKKWKNWLPSKALMAFMRLFKIEKTVVLFVK